MNGKRNIGLDFRRLAAHLEGRPDPRRLDRCGVRIEGGTPERFTLRACPEPAADVLHHCHPNIPPLGVCSAHLADWKREQLLTF